MAKKSPEEKSDIEECRDKINALLKEYNCSIATEDYCGLWLFDKDTRETLGGLNR